MDEFDENGEYDDFLPYTAEDLVNELNELDSIMYGPESNEAKIKRLHQMRRRKRPFSTDAEFDMEVNRQSDQDE